MNKFFEWAFRTRGNAVKELAAGKMVSPEKMFLSFMSHNPIFVSDGPAGLNGAVKGIGFIPREEYLEEALEAYKKHIATYVKGDREYSQRGLKLLLDYLYGEKAEKTIDFKHVYGVEMAFTKSFENYKANPQGSMVFYQPPVTSFELKGKMEIIGEHHEENEAVDINTLPVLQQFVNAQHDVYHLPNVERWKTRPVYKFTIEEIYDKSSTKDGFGTRIL